MNMWPEGNTSGNNTPSYRLTLAGVDITPRFNGRLSSLSLTDSRDGTSDQLDITLVNHDGRTPIPENGKTLSLAIGWHDDLIEKGDFIINEVEITGPPDIVIVRARAVDTTATLPGQKTRSWHRTTIGEIVDKIAAEHSLAPACGENFRAIRVSHIDQTSESDINFLIRLGERFDAVASIKAGRLLFVKKGQSTSASGTPLPAISILKQEVSSFNYVRTVSDSYAGVKAHYNEKSGAKYKYVIAGSGDNVRELKATYATKDDAAAAAEAEWARIKRGVEGLDMALAMGRADILVESPIETIGFDDTITDKKWTATEVTHRLSSTGYQTDLRCEIAELGKI
ncbi:contractile injection system protein, VgrG/Pvc8 family [Carnimonas bestiolae]|uniref:contractile injection system protein, VgrG/Pvc8 family n=1 Tax=Carnimonas bestiolae TaxID=3402172 RepID=UPI003EDC0888